MAWIDLLTNQMVTFTDAQTGGFTLQAGQSSVNSNQCMDKTSALTKYVLDSALMSSYTNNQLIPKSIWANAAVSGYSFSSGTSLAWPSSPYLAGYTRYTGTMTNVDDGYTTTAITLPVSFAMAAVSSTSLYVSTNGYITLGSGAGNIPNAPISSPASIAGNPGDAWLAPGVTILSDGDTQNIWYQINSEGNNKYNIKLVIYCGRYGNTTLPESYTINFYKDSTYQWIETRLKSNSIGGTTGPYNAINVAVAASTVNKVWRGSLIGADWVYQGLGRVV